MIKYLIGFVFLWFLFFFFDFPASAQDESLPEKDSVNGYFITYPKLLGSRLYMSRKYTALEMEDKIGGEKALFWPNTTHNLGIGATYDFFTLNLAYGFGFMNRDIGLGNTRYLDLQAHIYPKKYVIDLFAQFYRGYHLLPSRKFAPEGSEFFLRPDIRVIKLGASFQFLSNPEQFSYRAAFQQNERQIKSAGTFLYGMEWYAGSVRGDSTLLPSRDLTGAEREFQYINFFEIGPSGGAAYTLVFKKYFFITVSASANLSVGYTALDGDALRNSSWRFNPNFFGRAFVGYNNDKWSINANIVHNNIRLAENSGFQNSLMTGNYRINFIYRFDPGPKFRRQFDKYNPLNLLIN
ncbi:DUF4421 domain-containing protein [Pararhodonellum marinum]|uniref:DUF4421 domain-containing protein n=1 Tax=Pararhodonellum marinum TaxID=2755358 RepID=UPI00188E9653|nr:DUF4421 domain-containing protein [Pararhodonellum marinum]